MDRVGITGPHSHNKADETYEFTCSAHGSYAVHVSEIQFIRRVDAELKPACPACAQGALLQAGHEKVAATMNLPTRVADGRELLTKAPGGGSR